MDDGGIVAEVPILLKIWHILHDKGPPLGLHLNPAKCEWSWLNASATADCPQELKREGVALVPTDQVCILGVPLGSESFSASFVKERLFARVKVAMERLRDLNDSQSAMFLLRVSFGIVRATHFMRTTPLSHWKELAVEFDQGVRSAAESILGFLFDERAYDQACLTPSLGGLGLRRVVDHADAAFAASWRESQATAGESWAQPPQADLHLGSQTQASLVIDKAIHSRLVAESPSKLEHQRLTRLLAEHAGAWVTAVPSNLDGSECCLSPPVFRTAVKYRLGLKVARPDVLCSFCMQSFDVYGHHAACCKRNSDIIVRHNRLRNLVNRIAEEGLLSPVLEKRFLLGESSGRRPGDVTIPCWKNSKGLAVDVAVTSTFSRRNLSSPNPADAYGLKKHQKYDAGFRGSSFLFCALVMETTGGYSEEAVSSFRQLFRFAAHQQYKALCLRWPRLG